MGVGADFRHLALQPDATGLVASQLELLGDHGHDFTGMEACLLRGHGLGKRVRGELVHVFAADAVLFGQVFCRLDHVDASSRVFQRLPHVVLEAHGCAQLEAGAVVEGGNGVARHALGAHHQRGFAGTALDVLARLAKQLEARAADALGHDGGHLHGHARVQADVARQEELVKVARGHVARDHRTDVFAGHAVAGQHFAAHFDAEVGGGNVAQCAAVVHHRCAHAVEHPHVVE